MATIVDANNMQYGYQHVIIDVLDYGDDAFPRGKPTKELRNYTLVLDDPRSCWASGIGRSLNPKIGIAEALQLIGGFSYPELMVKISPNFKQFLDSDGVFHAPYGPRIRSQLMVVLRRLEQDPDTRQAVVTIWDPRQDSHDGEVDYPCTVSLQFMIRNDRLHLTTTMRSNDIWWGLPYDVFQFCQLQCTMASILNRQVGDYVHQVGSMHAYERDFEQLTRVANTRYDRNELVYDGLQVPSLAEARRTANELIRGQGDPVTSNERWMKSCMKEVE